jgi:nicotinamide mononucleotide adenylyltransferase
MAQVTAVVIAVISAVTHTNQVVAVALNRVMTVAALMTVAHAQSAQEATKRAMKVVATVTPLLVQATVTHTLVAATDLLMTGRVSFLTALTQPVHKVTALKVIAQQLARLTAALVTALPLVKNHTHATTLARLVATAIATAVATVKMPTVVTTAYWAPVTKAATMLPVPIALLHRNVVIALDRTAVQLVPIMTRVALVMRMQAAMHRVVHVALHN